MISSSKTYNVFVDCGNDTTIVKCNDNQIVIPTLVSISYDKVSKNAYHSVYENVEYVVGDTNKTTNTNIKLSKMDTTHKITMYTAIHQLVPNGAFIDLYVGLPIKTYYNLDYRQEFYDYMYRPAITITVDNIQKTFYIKQFKTLPEGIGYIMNNNIIEKVGVVDIGELTVDGYQSFEFDPIMETVFTKVGGARRLKTLIRDELNAGLLLNLQDYEIDDVISRGLKGTNKHKGNEIIHDCKEKYIKSIANEMITHGWEIDNLNVVFSGGGSIILRDVIEEYEGFSVSNNPINDNVDGFYNLVMEG